MEGNTQPASEAETSRPAMWWSLSPHSPHLVLSFSADQRKYLDLVGAA
jgi:hypothetical protein